MAGGAHFVIAHIYLETQSEQVGTGQEISAKV